MPLDNPRPGGNFVAEFQVSPTPWLTSSIVPGSSITRFDFPCVASMLAIQNLSTGSATAVVGFTRAGVSGSKRFRVTAGSQFSANVRFKTLYVGAMTSLPVDVDLVVGLTGIASRDVVDYDSLTGSIYFPGVS